MPKTKLNGTHICEVIIDGVVEEIGERWTPEELRLLPLERTTWYCVSEVDERGPEAPPSLFGWERWRRGDPWGGEVADSGRPYADGDGRRGRWLPVRLVQGEIVMEVHDE